MTTLPYNETKRQIEHLLPIGFAFLLPYLTWLQALAMAFLSILYGLFGSRRVISGTQRPDEEARGFSTGKFSYGLAVFLMILFFHERMFVVGAVWANLSVGDSLSNIAGRRWGTARLPWNPAKSWVGAATFLLSGTLSGALLIWWIGAPAGYPSLTRTEIWGYALFAAGICASVESLPDVVNDNISISFTGSVMLYAATHATWSWQFDWTRLAAALGINLFLGTLGYVAKTVAGSGWLGGVLIGTVIYYCTGLDGYLILFLFFILGSVSSRLGVQKKAAAGTAQDHGGRRGASNALANCLVGVLCAVGGATTSLGSTFELAFVGAFATATFDTMATEIGQWLGRSPILLFPPRRVASGTEGAVSLEGTVAGFAGAFAVGAAAWALGMLDGVGSVCVVLGACLGSLAESLIGAADTRQRPMKNDILNLTNTVIGACTAVLLGRLAGGWT